MGVFSRKRRDGSTAWYYDFMHAGIRYRGVGGTTKTQALRAQEKVRSQVLNGEYELENSITNPRIEVFAETYLSRRGHLRSHKRDALSVKNLLKVFSGKVLSQIKASDIEDYKAKRQGSGVSNATVNRELACLKRMYNLAIKWGDTKKNPVVDVDFLKEPPGRTRYLSYEDSAKLLASCDAHLYPIVFTALNTGMRLGEILALTWHRVHIDNAIDPYIELKETKNNKPRFVPLNDDMVTLLNSLRSRQTDTEHVFIGTRGTRLKSVRKPFATAQKKAGILDFRFHDLRHTFASHFVMSGGDLLTLKEILGHSSMKMVERYAHLAAGYKRRQVNNLNGVFAGRHPIATAPKMAKTG